MDDPNAAFYRSFMTAAFVALPEGIWDVSAWTSFIEGTQCQGEAFSFRTTVRVTITP